jgi:hypothetical protein
MGETMTAFSPTVRHPTPKIKQQALSIQRIAKKLMAGRIDFPETKVGEYSIIKREIAAPWVTSIRDALFTGVPVVDYPGPITFHELRGPEGVWMSDLPCEMFQMHRELAVNARGNVLVGGLGLGIVVRMAALKRSVRSVTVVDRQPEVIEMVGPYLSGKTTVIQADINEYVKTVERGRFDVALLDTWQGTGEWAWQMEVVPLRRAIGVKIPRQRVHCWHEDVMINQVANTLYRAASLPVDVFKQYVTCHYHAFQRGIVDLGWKGCGEVAIDRQDMQLVCAAEEANRTNPELQRYVALFLQTVGEPIWEHYFGRHWDEACATNKV